LLIWSKAKIFFVSEYYGIHIYCSSFKDTDIIKYQDLLNKYETLSYAPAGWKDLLGGGIRLLKKDEMIESFKRDA